MDGGAWRAAARGVARTRALGTSALHVRPRRRPSAASPVGVKAGCFVLAAVKALQWTLVPTSFQIRFFRTHARVDLLGHTTALIMV